MAFAVHYYNSAVETDRGKKEFDRDVVQIGSSEKNDLVLVNPFVSSTSLLLELTKRGMEILCTGENRVKIGDHILTRGQRFLLRQDDEIDVFPYKLTVELIGDWIPREKPQSKLDTEVADLIRVLHADIVDNERVLLRDLHELIRIEEEQTNKEAWLVKLSRKLEELEDCIPNYAERHDLFEKRRAKRLHHVSGHALRSAMLEKIVAIATRMASSPLVIDAVWSRHMRADPNCENDLQNLVAYTEKKLDIHPADSTAAIDSIERGFWEIWKQLADGCHFHVYLAVSYITKQIKDILFGLGPLEDLLRLPAISEIMVVDKDRIYVERGGQIEMTGRRFVSDEVTKSIIERIVYRVHRRIDVSQPLVDARLSDGSRVNAVIPPLAVSGPCLTIRRFSAKRLTVKDLVKGNTLSHAVAQFLEASVIARQNILVSGGTGTGKTTLLNCLSNYIPAKERIVTIEDTAELQLAREHVVRLETRSANREGKGEYSIRDLVKNSLRMRPDRIIVGECRGPEALDMLQAMNTGHDGSLTTIHANSSSDVILRLEVLVQMASSELPLQSIDRQIASAINLIVQLQRMPCGHRRIIQVTEIVGMDRAGERVVTSDIFALDPNASVAELTRPTGHLPTFMDGLIDKNLLALETFYL